MSVLLQIDNLRTYPIVREREEKGELLLRAWFFNIGSGEVEFFDGHEKRWRPLAEEVDITRESQNGKRAEAVSVLPPMGDLLAVRAAVNIVDEQA